MVVSASEQSWFGFRRVVIISSSRVKIATSTNQPPIPYNHMAHNTPHHTTLQHHRGRGRATGPLPPDVVQL